MMVCHYPLPLQENPDTLRRILALSPSLFRMIDMQVVVPANQKPLIGSTVCAAVGMGPGTCAKLVGAAAGDRADLVKYVYDALFVSILWWW